MLQIGNKVEDRIIKTHLGEEFKLSEVDAKYIVLYFYPKDSTPGCTVQACGIRDNLKDIEKFNAKIFGISRDPLKNHLKFAHNHGLNYPLIVDENNALSTYFGVLKEKSMFGKKYMGIVRTTFILNHELTVVAVMENVNSITHSKDLIKKLEELSSRVA